MSEISGSSSTPEHRCKLCLELIDLDDPTLWKQVRGWVGGPKKDSMRLREDTGWYAHDLCVKRLQEGQAPTQPDLFSEGNYDEVEVHEEPALPF